MFAEGDERKRKDEGEGYVLCVAQFGAARVQAQATCKKHRPGAVHQKALGLADIRRTLISACDSFFFRNWQCFLFMLAYGRSQRTLRFAYQEEEVSLETANDSILGTPDELLLSGPTTKFSDSPPGFKSTPKAARSAAKLSSTWSTRDPVTSVAPRENGAIRRQDHSFSTTTAPMNAVDAYQRQPRGKPANCDESDTMRCKQELDGVVVGDRRSEDASVRRPKFRLEMDLGSDSDSSVDEEKHNGDVSYRQPCDSALRTQSGGSSAGRGFRYGAGRCESRTSSAKTADDGKTTDDGGGTVLRPSGQRKNRSAPDGRVGGSSINQRSFGQEEPRATTARPTNATRRARRDESVTVWEDSGEIDRAWSEGGSSERSRRRGIDVDHREFSGSQGRFGTPDHHPDTRAGPTMKSPRQSQPTPMRPPFVVHNPYGALRSGQAAAVTPDMVHGQASGKRPPEPRFSAGPTATGSTSTGGRVRHRTEFEGTNHWEEGDNENDSGLRQAPALVGVQDVYPPELSRLWQFQNFNSIQSALYPTVAKSDCNVVVSAPTGCGKTVVLEMAIARLLHESAMSLGNRKIIYISPIKALCQQTLDDWTAKFSPLGIRLAELTSDSASGASNGAVSLRDLASADVILTTPEKWDSVTRRWKEHAFLVGTVALVLVDEVHTIGEERGATLEVILTRMKLVSRSPEVVSMGLPASRMRFIALSATLPNAMDFGAFIGAEVFRFGAEYRPVPLQTHVIGYASGSNPFLFDRGLNKHVSGIVARYSNGKPALVFCGSKKDTETLAGALAQGKDYARSMGSQVMMQYLMRAADDAEDPQLAKLIRKGVAIHNSGLSPGDRGLVERAFLSGSLSVLVATTTLAMGVNLPARLVIIKGTNHYRGAKGYQELPKSAILQMMGRAGRPGFDSSGVAVVMTSQANKKALERLSAGQEAVESSLQARLLEALNSEVCQGETIHDIGEAIEWLRRSAVGLPSCPEQRAKSMWQRQLQ